MYCDDLRKYLFFYLKFTFDLRWNTFKGEDTQEASLSRHRQGSFDLVPRSEKFTYRVWRRTRDAEPADWPRHLRIYIQI